MHSVRLSFQVFLAQTIYKLDSQDISQTQMVNCIFICSETFVHHHKIVMQSMKSIENVLSSRKFWSDE